MPDQPDLAGLEAERARLYADLSQVRDFRRGALNAVRRKCGKSNCACARPGHPGHGPQYNLTKWAGGKTVTVHLRPGPELEKVEREVAEWERFKSLTGQIAEVNEAICDARPASPRQPRTAAPDPEGRKGLCEALAAEAAAEVARLAGAVAASLAAGEGIEAAELAIRAGLTSLGRGVLENLLTADAGYRGPRIGCGTGHQAEFVSYRPKTVDTGLGPVTVNRAWYHCATCGHGLAPRDAELGVAGETMTPGLAKMAARAAEAVPFTRGAGLVGALAGITLTGRRLGGSAEADGRAAAAVIEAQAAAIAARTLVPLPPADLPDKLYVAIDGTGVPMRTAETDGRDGKGDDGKARTREVKLCCAFTQTTVDADGYPVRDPHSSSYLATFAPAAEFGVLMAAEARRRGAGHIRQLTILGDGAHWICYPDVGIADLIPVPRLSR